MNRSGSRLVVMPEGLRLASNWGLGIRQAHGTGAKEGGGHRCRGLSSWECLGSAVTERVLFVTG